MQWDDYFSYNPETGDLMWKVYRSPNAKPGDIIRGTKSRNKHLRVNLNRKCYQVHCIIWEMHNGPIPEGYEIDHIDHDRWNNRLSNLRLVDDEGNARNMSLFKTNTSGVSGVGWHSQRKKWRATIWHKCKQISLGLFDNFDDAVRARRDAEIKYGYHPNHGH